MNILFHQKKDLEKIAEQLPVTLDPDLIQCEIIHDHIVVQVYSNTIVRVLTLLRDHKDFMFNTLIDVCAVDYLHRQVRFDMVYHLLSTNNNARIRVKTQIGLETSIPSVTGVFPNANWYEREVWDLFGIKFTDHPDLRRILTDYDFEGHPLRKDFPLSGFEQVRYDEVEKRVVKEPVSLTQDFRSFDYLSPWEGYTKTAFEQNAKEGK